VGFLGGTFNALSPEIVSLLSVAFGKDTVGWTRSFSPYKNE